MSERNREYLKLPGRKARTFAHLRYSLWQGRDHLLQISNSHFTEDYQRFYYRDIQSIVVCRTDRATVSNAILVAIAAVAVFAATFSGSIGRPLWGIVAGFFVVLFLLDFVRGPTCRCYLRTAVQNEHLRSLDRLRPARKTIARLAPLIEAAQAELAHQESVADDSTPPVAATVPVAPAARGPVAKPPRHESGAFHIATFVFLLLTGFLSYAGLFHNNVVITLVLIGSLLAVGACTLTALVKQHESDIGRELQRTLWATLAYICAMAVLAYVYWFAFLFQNVERVRRPEEMYNYWGWLQRFAAQSATDTPLLFVIYMFSIIGSISLGSLGTFWISRHWRRPASGPPPIPAGP